MLHLEVDHVTNFVHIFVLDNIKGGIFLIILLLMVLLVVVYSLRDVHYAVQWHPR